MIPKKFHRVWIGNSNNEAEAFWQKSKEMHPDWEHITYSSRLPDGFSLISEVVNYCDVPSYHSDLIRLEALYLYGGFYVDADIEVFKNFNSFCNYSNPIVGWETKNNSSIGSAVIGAPPKNKYIYEVLSHSIEIIKKDSTNKTISYDQDERYFLPNLLNKHWSKNNEVTKMSRKTFFPYDLGEKAEKRYFDFSKSPDTYAAHHWSLSWLKDGMDLLPQKNAKTDI
jgi:mannosyltransferase OCH1-like enzyme